MSPDHPSNANDLWWNVLTFITLGTLVLVVVVMVVIFRDPAASVNPFPPPTATLPPPTVTPTQTPIVLPEIWTATPLQVTTPKPSASVPASQVTVTVLAEDVLAVPSPTVPSGGFAYELKSPAAALDGAVFHPEWECAWMGVAGQTEDWLGRPSVGIQVVVGGSIGDRTVDMNTLTGTALQYGPGGYEFKLANGPYATEGTLWLQLFDQASQPLSKRTYFNTSGDCDRNLIIVNFKQRE